MREIRGPSKVKIILMKCPACNAENIPGEDFCESCQESLTGVDGLSAKDLHQKSILEDPIRNLTFNKTVFVSSTESVLEAAKKMNEFRVGSALVGSPDKLEGIMTERDILYKVMGEGKNPENVPVSTVMTPNPETLSESDSIAYAINLMSLGGYRHIPLLQKGKPVAVVSIRAILSYLPKILL